MANLPKLKKTSAHKITKRRSVSRRPVPLHKTLSSRTLKIYRSPIVKLTLDDIQQTERLAKECKMPPDISVSDRMIARQQNQSLIDSLLQGI